MVPVWSGSGKATDIHLLLYPDTMERVNSLASFYNDTNPAHEGSTQIPPKAPPPHTITVQLGFQQVNFAGHIQYITEPES